MLFLLLTTAGLLTKSLLKATEADPGFRPEHLISAQITLPTAVYRAPAQIAGFFDRLLSGLSTLPGVRQTGAMSDLPMGSTSNVIISIEGQGRNTERVDTVFCRGNALELLSVTLLRGRLLQPEDQIGKPHTVVISEAVDKRVWPHGDPIERHIRFGVDIPNNVDMVDRSWRGGGCEGTAQQRFSPVAAISDVVRMGQPDECGRTNFR